MRAIVATKTLTAADADNIALVQALGAAGPLLLNGDIVVAGDAVLDTARRIGITSSGNDSGITFTITGDDYANNEITEVVTGSNGGVAASLQDFLAVNSIIASGAVAGTVSVGTTTVGSTPWFFIDNWIVPIEVGAGVEFLSGAGNVTVEVTDDNPLAPLYIYQAGWGQPTPGILAVPVPVPFGWPGLIGLLANASGVIDRPVAAARLTVNSGAGNFQLTLRQAGTRIS